MSHLELAGVISLLIVTFAARTVWIARLTIF